MRRILFRLTVMALVILGPMAVLPATGNAWGRGFNRVETATEDRSANTGYGPGWVTLSYKTNGPMVGYLFARDFRFADGTVKPAFDHMDIRGVRYFNSMHPTIDYWPWGYAHGSFEGCAFAYGRRKFALERTDFSSPNCADGFNAGPRGTWWQDETVFCTAHEVDPMCSPVGVWASRKPPDDPGTRTVRSGGCDAYGNLGAAGVFGTGTPRPTHYLGHVPEGDTLKLRYVVRGRQWFMAKWADDSFVGGIRWAFFPRSCIP